MACYEVPWERVASRPLAVVIADDSALLRSGIARLLADHDIRVLGEARDAEELLVLVDSLQPDLVITDIRMPPTFALEGIQAAEAIREAHPETGILVLSQHVESRAALGLLQQHERGIGYLLKDRVADIDDFIEAVTRVAAGGTAIDPEIVALLLGRPRPDDLAARLTARETDVLSLMAQGRSNRAIGDQLGLSSRTVESHVASIFTKLDLEPETDDHRRVLAVVTWLRSTAAT
jgi:serine/threonine-protein kinase